MKDLPVSVIIPTYNRQQMVARAIRSVLNQTIRAAEILVIDDGSTDDTEAVVKSEFPDTVYVRQQHAGVSAARNRGIENSNSDWIALLDSDDEWLPQKLELQIKALNANPRYSICHTNEIWIRNGKRVNPKRIHQKYGGYIFNKCLPLCIISPSSVLIHRHVFARFGLFDVNLPACEDYDMWLRLCAFLPVLYIQTPLIKKYGGHPNQLSRKHWGMDRFRISALEKILHSDELHRMHKKAATAMILKKLDIFIAGARKRKNNLDETGGYTGKKEYYLRLLKQL